MRPKCSLCNQPLSKCDGCGIRLNNQVLCTHEGDRHRHYCSKRCLEEYNPQARTCTVCSQVLDTCDGCKQPIGVGVVCVETGAGKRHFCSKECVESSMKNPASGISIPIPAEITKKILQRGMMIGFGVGVLVVPHPRGVDGGVHVNCPICANDAPASSTFAGLYYCPVCNLTIPEGCPGEYQGVGDDRCWECLIWATCQEKASQVAEQGVNEPAEKLPK